MYPRATEDGRLQTEADWQVVPTRVKRGLDRKRGGILAGVTIGEGALIGAGASVTHDIPDHQIAKGIPGAVDVPSHETKDRIDEFNLIG